MLKILMVCLGNICRSPLAEAILVEKLKNKGLYDVQVDSAGTSSYHIGEKPDLRTITNARKHGLEISHLITRQFTLNDFDLFDKIYVMDHSNYTNVVELARNEEDIKKVELILNVSHPGSNMTVPDPYFGGDLGFENVYNLLNEACDRIVMNIQNKNF
ncbi:MAG: low molecular weight phosphotyrosine protein phosphatase [Bacteroidetes bacterium]|nr:low molecular weight phosphotyrosine protein phosphatase [Bacteroidota bacterium]HET6243030.1 low molecular weight protein-tyrosine-phosphatase [Bacteroidia bacterium]